MRIIKSFVLVLLTALTLTTFGQTSDHRVKGFRGLEFGEKFDKAAFDDMADPKFLLRDQEDGYRIYTIENEDLSIGTVELDRILYYFDQFDQFKKFTLSGSSAYYDDMENILYQKFGRPDERFVRPWEGIRIWDRDEALVVFREQRSLDFAVHIRGKKNLMTESDVNANIDDF